MAPRIASLLAALCISLAAAGSARGDTDARRRAPGTRRRVLAPAAAVVPGAIVHGAGHWVLGERRTALRLLAIEGVGVGLAGSAGAVLVATGASRHYAGPLVGMVVGGVGLFTLSLAADLYGASGGACAGGTPLLATTRFDVEAGYAYVYDPQFDYRSFAVIAGEVRLGAERIAPSAHIALDDDNQRVRVEAAHRFVGAGAARPTGDGSRLELTGALTHHRYGDDAFRVTTGELSLGGRLDLVRIGPTLAGSFAEMSAGLAGELTDYQVAGAGADLGEMLLSRFAWGMYLGRGRPLHGEISVYYDHRRDTLAGGTSPGPGPGSGFLGYFGSSALVYIGARYGVRATMESGAARVAQLAFITRLGDVP